MPSPKSEPDLGKCQCGRPRAEAVTTPYLSAQGRLAFRRCQCGSEWTERLGNAMLADPVSTDELIEVHQRLAELNGPLTKLIDSV